MTSSVIILIALDEDFGIGVSLVGFCECLNIDHNISHLAGRKVIEGGLSSKREDI